MMITGTTRYWHPVMSVATTTPSYWLNWKVFLCSMWILISVLVASILISKNECRRRNHDPNHDSEDEIPPGTLYGDEVWRACLRSVHPGYLLAFRLFAFVVLLMMLIMNVIVDGGTIFYYYTQWTFALVTVYFALGSWLSMEGCHRYGHDAYLHFDDAEGANSKTTIATATRDPPNLERRKAGFLAYAFQIIFQVNGGAVILTDTVFWFIIVPFLAIKDYKLNFLIVNMHLINAVFLLVETALNSLRFPVFRIGYFFLWTVVYVVFQWILHAFIWIWWPYPFLDLSSSYSPLWYSTVSVLHIPCYGVFALIVKAKHSLLSKWFRKSCWGNAVRATDGNFFGR